MRPRYFTNILITLHCINFKFRIAFSRAAALRILFCEWFAGRATVRDQFWGGYYDRQE